MTSRGDLARRAETLERQRVPFVEATVVRAQHPTSAHAGDTALVHPDGTVEGFVGGSCAEASVRLHALEVLASGEPLLLRIRAGEPATVRDEEGAVTVANPCVSGGTLEIFLEPRRPPGRVVVVGETPVARALAELGGVLGLDVEAGDGVEVAGADAVVVASHGRGEEAPLEAALRAGVPYVALVASRIRAAAVLESLDVGGEQRARVHSPAGLDIGARTAPEIALSVLAELVAERPRRTPSTVADAAPSTAVDPVCGMTVAVVPGAVSAERDGETVWFCGDGCREAFLGRV